MWRTVILGALAAAALGGCSLGGGGEPGTEGVDPPFSTAGWDTDFSTHSVPLDEFMGGGPPKDGIPSIDDPRFVAVEEADRFLDPREPVAVVELDGEVRAYPIQILVWHEIVNDEIDGEPVAATYCPLCNSTVAFSRVVDGEPFEFGTTGMLRKSDLVMYDRGTESWWQQTARGHGRGSGVEVRLRFSHLWRLDEGEVFEVHDVAAESRRSGWGGAHPS